jgi:hypothetical protein
MSLCGECCALSGREEESYPKCGVSEFDCESSIMRNSWHTGGERLCAVII